MDVVNIDYSHIRILAINEHGSGKGAPTGDLVQSFLNEWKLSGGQYRFLHVKGSYVPGALRPSRIFNQFILTARTLVHLVCERWHSFKNAKQVIVLTTTSPPNFHILVVLICKLLGFPAVLWLMDAHPETEARILQSKGPLFSWLSYFLRYLEKVSTNLFSGVIPLDDAMAEGFKLRTGFTGQTATVNPWITYHKPAAPLRAVASKHRIHLVYAGNYGFAHDLTPLAMSFRNAELVAKDYSITFIGMSTESQQVLRNLFAIQDLETFFQGRLQNFSDLVTLMPSFDLGVVSLAERMSGLACPSKAYTYASCGLPILYVGPSKSLSEAICKEGYGILLAQLINCEKDQVNKLLGKIGKVMPDPKQTNFLSMRDMLVQVTKPSRVRPQ